MDEIIILCRYPRTERKEAFLVDADVEGGLALHVAAERGGGYVVTHVASGYRITLPRPWLEAMDLRSQLLALDIDWAMDGRALMATHGQMLEALFPDHGRAANRAWMIEMGYVPQGEVG